MDIWFVVFATVCIAVLLNALVFLKTKSNIKLPPGPRGVPILTNFLWLRKSTTETEETIKKICSKFGPIITLPVGLGPTIFISSHSLAHEALVQKGAIFADRPKPFPTEKILTSNQHNISLANYGSTWRILRRNLNSEILHPSRAKEFHHARKWVRDILLNRLRDSAGSDTRVIKVIGHFRFAMFSLLVGMCFGETVDESNIREIDEIQHDILTSLKRFQILNRWPFMTWVLLRSRWTELYDLKKKQLEVLIPLIRARKEVQKKGDITDDDKSSRFVICYVDTLLTVELLDDSNTKRKLNEEEIVAACSEFLDAGTETTSTSLQWIMANIVKYPHIQEKLFREIKGVIGEKAEEIGENNISKMPFLKAVVLEGLRRHPPAHFLVPHAVTQEVELGGYIIPKNASINFSVAEMGRDPNVWKDPMQFKPERFMAGGEEFDITGSHEIKMMPFGAGRRLCPGYGLAMHHLEYYVANLVLNFEWASAEGYEVDLSEKQEYSMVMKYPLHALISPRKNN